MKYVCLIVSTGRAASTSIYRYLDFAGRLNLPKLKEPHFLCDVTSYEGLNRDISSIYISDKLHYQSLYKHSKLILDASCGYFFSLDNVISNIKALDLAKKPKVIFLYREPISRALSWYNERVKRNLTQADSPITDILSCPHPGLWWENYYDNVLYDSL